MIIMTKHNEYKSITPDMLKSYSKVKVIIDGRDTLDPEKYIASGYIFKSVGKGSINREVKKG